MRFLFYILMLGVAAWFGLFLYQNPGNNVEIAYQDWIIQVSLSALVLGCVAVILVYTVLSAIFKTYRKVREWITGSTLRAVTKNANLGWTSLEEGDWAHAENYMLKAAKHSETPEHYYLAAAKAAQELGAIDRRDNSLRQALRAAPQNNIAVGITQAKLQLQHGQLEHSLATIQALTRAAPQNAVVLKLAAKVFSTVGEWPELIRILPQLRKHQILPAEELAVLEAKSYAFMLRAEVKKSGQQALATFWDMLPRNIRQQPQVVQEYVHILLELSAYNEAEHVIRNALRKQWDVSLVKLYGLVLSSDLGKQISTAESWLRTNQSEPALLLTLARLCLAHQLWGKARNYLDASLSLEPNPDAYAELARLLSFLGEQQKALECYKKGLLEVATVLPIETAQK